MQQVAAEHEGAFVAAAAAAEEAETRSPEDAESQNWRNGTGYGGEGYGGGGENWGFGGG